MIIGGQSSGVILAFFHGFLNLFLVYAFKTCVEMYDPVYVPIAHLRSPPLLRCVQWRGESLLFPLLLALLSIQSGNALSGIASAPSIRRAMGMEEGVKTTGEVLGFAIWTEQT